MRSRLALASTVAFGWLSLAAGCGSSSSNSAFPGPSDGSGANGAGEPGGSANTPVLGSADGGPSGTSSSLLGDAGCASASASATRAPVYMLFVLDGSGSMGEDNKWTAVTGALTSMFATMTDPGIGAGLIVYADTLDQTLSSGPGPYPEPGIDVPIGYVTPALDAALDKRMSGSPNSNTPTYYALQGGYGELGTFAPSAPLESGGSKVLVLITDGVPTDHNCSIKSAGTNYPTNPCVTMAAQEDMGASPVLTFVIGVGQFPSSNAQDFDPAWLGNLAQAGGGAPTGCNPNEVTTNANLCYFEVDPTQASSASVLQTQFTNALEAIRGQVLSCTFPLQSTGLGAIDPGLVNVTVGGATVPQSPTDGWTFNDPQDPTAVIFNGAACTQLKNDASAKVSIVVGCATITAK